MPHIIKCLEAKNRKIGFRLGKVGDGTASRKDWTLGEVKVKVAQSCLTLCNPMDYTVLGILQAIILGIEPRSPTLQANSLTAEPQGKPPALVGRFFTTSATWAPRMHMLATKGGGYFPSRTDGETEV